MTVPHLAHLDRDDHASSFVAWSPARHSPGGRPRWCPYRIAALLLLCAGLLSATIAYAEGTPPFLAEPTIYTDVLDAFAGKGLPDFRLSLGFLNTTETSVIQRETNQVAKSGTRTFTTFADHQRVAKQIWMSAEVGLFRDLMLSISAPFVLEDYRTLQPNALAVRSGLLDQAVSSSFDSRIRDGVPYVDVGLAYGVINQFEHPNLPTWTLRLNAQFSTGEAMTPCLHGQRCFRGASRGTVRLQGETRFSYRYRLAEPYFGFSYAREAVTTGEDNFWPSGKVPGDLDRNPPTRAGWTAGVSVIPWEDRDKMQRLAVSSRLSAIYVSRGRDYSPLFDVLGTSSMLTDNVFNSTGNTARFSGMTTVDAHVNMRGDLELLIRAARYVRFRFGLGITSTTTHLITGANPCAGAIDALGHCQNGQNNPGYQSLIDRPGNRFRVTDVLGIDLSASATGQF